MKELTEEFLKRRLSHNEVGCLLISMMYYYTNVVPGKEPTMLQIAKEVLEFREGLEKTSDPREKLLMESFEPEEKGEEQCKA